jgi:hypothetical protein
MHLLKTNKVKHITMSEVIATMIDIMHMLTIILKEVPNNIITTTWR